MTLKWTFEEVVTDQCGRLSVWAGLERDGEDPWIVKMAVHMGTKDLGADTCNSPVQRMPGGVSAQAGGGQKWG